MTMAEAISNPTVCPKCGSDVRPDSAFCYNCGGSVAVESSDPVKEDTPRIEEKITQPAPGLRSARDLRRRERPTERELKRIKWEPAGTASDVQLIAVTVAIMIFTIVVIALAFYLR